MPKKGFKSITLPDVVYDEFQKKYNDLRPSLFKVGINSYSAWITSLLYKSEK